MFRRPLRLLIVVLGVPWCLYAPKKTQSAGIKPKSAKVVKKSPRLKAAAKGKKGCSQKGETRTLAYLYDEAEQNAWRHLGYDQAQTTVMHAMFSSARDKQVRDALISLIKAEKESIKVAVYTFTDMLVAQALREAAERGVIVEAVFDPYSAQYGAAKQVADIASMFKPDFKGEWAPLMHHKFFIFGKNLDDKPLLWTGSFNITKSAQDKNFENVLLLDDPGIIENYEQEFERVKAVSDPHWADSLVPKDA